MDINDREAYDGSHFHLHAMEIACLSSSFEG